jgi:hypothetical protein
VLARGELALRSAAGGRGADPLAVAARSHAATSGPQLRAPYRPSRHPEIATPGNRRRLAGRPRTADPVPGDLGAWSRWGDVVEQSGPAIKPLLRECRPITNDGVRVTLAFPEERSFMRAKAATRAPAIEQLLSTVLGGSWAIECVASNVELEPLTVAEAVVSSPGDTEGLALLEGVLRITGASWSTRVT